MRAAIAPAGFKRLLRRTPCSSPSSSPWIVAVLSEHRAAPRAVTPQSLSGSRHPPCRSTTPATAAARTMASTAPLGHQLNSFQNAARPDMASSVKRHVTPALLREVRDVWFEHLASPDSLVMPTWDDSKRWFFGGEALDRVCVERFAPTLEALRESGVASGADVLDAVRPTDPRDWLSLILLLDQMPRNCYRGPSAAVAFTVFDPVAREVSLAALARGIPDAAPQIRWRFAYRNWFYMPLMHSEDVGAHETAVAAYERMRGDVYALAEAGGEAASGAGGDGYRAAAAKVVRADVDAAKKLVGVYVDFEKKHFDIIKRFGRYPHRNEALGRQATAEEAAYLAGGGATFTQ